MTVVTGVDESGAALAVLGKAAHEAKMRGTDLHVVHVAHFPIIWTDVPVDPSVVIEAQRAAVWSVIEPAMESLDVPVRRIDLEGYPPDQLIEYATKAEAELLVVGTRGRGGLASLVLGSTSHRAIHEAPCDVLVVKSGD